MSWFPSSNICICSFVRSAPGPWLVGSDSLDIARFVRDAAAKSAKSADGGGIKPLDFSNSRVRRVSIISCCVRQHNSSLCRRNQRIPSRWISVCCALASAVACSAVLLLAMPPDAHDPSNELPYFFLIIADSVSRRNVSASPRARIPALSSRIICFAFASTSSRSLSVIDRDCPPCDGLANPLRGCAVDRYACRTSRSSLCNVVICAFCCHSQYMTLKNNVVNPYNAICFLQKALHRI